MLLFFDFIIFICIILLIELVNKNVLFYFLMLICTHYVQKIFLIQKIV